MSWRWISIAALLAALVAVYGALVDRNIASDTDDDTPPPPGYYLKDAIITQTQPDGSPNLRLVAARIEQRRKEEDILLNDVRLDYLKIADRPWVLTAEHGKVPEDSRIVEFTGNVDLHPLLPLTPLPQNSSARKGQNQKPEQQAPTWLRTQALAIDTENNRAYTTQSPTAIRFGTYTMTVKRLEADLTTEKVRLISARGKSGS
jgi:LPS export ABC transporter protein LptC